MLTSVNIVTLREFVLEQIDNMLWRIVLPYAVFGIIVVDNIIVNSAPIGKWMIGKTLDFIQTWVASKNGTILCTKDIL